MVSNRPRRSREMAVFATAVAVAVAHALDDAFTGRQPGIDLGQHAAAGLISVLVALAALAVFAHGRPGVRAVLAAGLGIPALVNGAMHIVHIKLDAAAASDVTGALAAVAGIVLIGLGASIPWRHRHRGALWARERWLPRALAVPATLLFALLAVVPVAVAVFETHKPRELVGAAPSRAYEPVSFDSTDGLRLRGWYRPSRNGAAILVVHGGGGDRTGAVRQARMLDRHGYGVLLYDARGRGESEGSPNSYGWDWDKDAAGALDFLAGRRDIRRGRIGALGLSSGGDTVLDVAATRDDIGAVIADGAAMRTFDDVMRVADADPLTPVGWLMFKAIGVMSGSAPGRPLEDLVAEISSPLLLISAGTKFEKDANDLFARAAVAPVEHWNLPDATHTGAARSHAAQYEKRVNAFFDRALLGATTP